MPRGLHICADCNTVAPEIEELQNFENDDETATANTVDHGGFEMAAALFV